MFVFVGYLLNYCCFMFESCPKLTQAYLIYIDSYHAYSLLGRYVAKRANTTPKLLSDYPQTLRKLSLQCP